MWSSWSWRIGGRKEDTARNWSRVDPEGDMARRSSRMVCIGGGGGCLEIEKEGTEESASRSVCSVSNWLDTRITTFLLSVTCQVTGLSSFLAAVHCGPRSNYFKQGGLKEKELMLPHFWVKGQNPRYWQVGYLRGSERESIHFFLFF